MTWIDWFYLAYDEILIREVDGDYFFVYSIVFSDREPIDSVTHRTVLAPKNWVAV